MKKPIRIISPNFDLLGEIDNYVSLIFIRSFFEVREFELYVSVDVPNANELKQDNIILLGSDKNKAGIIEHIEKAVDEEGKELVLVKGPTLKGITRRRTTVPPIGQAYDRAEGNQETIIKHFVNNNIVNPADADRKIPQVVIAEDKNRGSQDRWRTRYEQLDEKISEIAIYSDLGWDMWLDTENQRWVFDVIEGRDLTANQDILPPVIFSVDFENIGRRHFIESLLNYKNVAYAGGKGEEEERLIQQIGEVTGLSRRETFLDCSNAEDIVELKEIGNQKLKELDKIIAFEADIIPNDSFRYEEDYDLGDVVTLRDEEWGIVMNARIVEIKEIYEGEFRLEHTFGRNIPDIIDKLKNENKRVVR